MRIIIANRQVVIETTNIDHTEGVAPDGTLYRSIDGVWEEDCPDFQTGQLEEAGMQVLRDYLS